MGSGLSVFVKRARRLEMAIGGRIAGAWISSFGRRRVEDVAPVEEVIPGTEEAAAGGVVCAFDWNILELERPAPLAAS